MAEPVALGTGDVTPRYEFFLFGRFQAKFAGQDLSGFDHRKIQELLSHLILSTRPHHREVLAETLWGHVGSETDFRKVLRQALWQLRGATRALVDAPALLLVETDWVQLNLAASLWVDVWQLQEAFTAVRGMSPEQMSVDEWHGLRGAADLYRADLLEGVYHDWCVYERERLRALYLTCVDKLLAYCETHDRADEGLMYGERILAHDRAHERTHWRMMRLQYLAGDRIQALRQFRRCEVALMEELGVRPSGQTMALFEQIREDRFGVLGADPPSLTDR